MSITDLFLLTLVVKKVRSNTISQRCDITLDDSSAEEQKRLLRKSWNDLMTLSVKRLSSHDHISDNRRMTDNSDDMNYLDYSGTVMVRDFAYSVNSPLFHGQEEQEVKRPDSILSLSSPEFHGSSAHALYDFIPETEYELGMKAGDIVWVQYRQSPGWLVADIHDQTGLIPETYVEFIHTL